MQHAPVATDSPTFDLGAIKAHVIARLTETDQGHDPFNHMWVENIYPDDFYQALLENKRMRLGAGAFQERKQDSQAYVNRRYPLVECDDEVINVFRAVWSDLEVKATAYRRFYSKDIQALAEETEIHTEFEYTFCEPDRFQNIHVDIPPKCLSFVFYLPDEKLDDKTELDNATILYDKDMKPSYAARFRDNSVCIFAPHFYSYHGFSSTIPRDAIVMFLISQPVWDYFRSTRKSEMTTNERLLDAICHKLRRFELTEYGNSEDRLAAEVAACRINAPSGRVMIDSEGKPLPVPDTPF